MIRQKEKKKQKRRSERERRGSQRTSTYADCDKARSDAGKRMDAYIHKGQEPQKKTINSSKRNEKRI